MARISVIVTMGRVGVVVSPVCSIKLVFLYWSTCYYDLVAFSLLGALVISVLS